MLRFVYIVMKLSCLFSKGVAFARSAKLYDGRVAYNLGVHVVRFEGGLVLQRMPNGSWTPASIDALLK